MRRGEYRRVNSPSSGCTTNMPGQPVNRNNSDVVVTTDNDNEDENLTIVEFINKYLEKRICKRFVKKVQNIDSDVCFCGYTETIHSKKAKDNGKLNEARTWNYNDDTEAVPTDAFGEMEFFTSGQKICKYVRVDCDTNVDRLIDLMLDYWQMEKPNLLISVTGGAQNFTMHPRLNEVFREGLVKAAESTRAWIVTGGTSAGVMKHVGEAIRDHTIRRGSKKQLVVLGIATWGCIENKEGLVSAEPTKGKNYDGHWPVSYEGHEGLERQKGESPLDPNHTHFILVDNGTQLQFGAEIDLRARLESKISKMKTLGSAISIPIVCVVLEGGPNTLETVRKAIESGTPAIIVAGSGRAADVLAFAYSRCQEHEVEDTLSRKHTIAIYDESLWPEVEEMIKKEFRKNNPRDIQQLVGNVRACVDKIDHMTVFRLDGGSSGRDIDITILRALLKVNRGKRIDQLRLALAWDRVDIAKEEIFADDVRFEDSELEELMFQAIVNNRPDFVELFLEKGLNLNKFERWMQLYNHPVTKDNSRHLAKIAKRRDTITLKHVDDLIRELVGGLFEPAKTDSDSSSPSSSGRTEKNGASSVAIALQPINPYCLQSERDDPARKLFIWSILTNMKSLAMVFWSEGKDDTALAVIGHLLLKSLLAKEEQDSELATKLEEQVSFFEQLSVGLLSECYSSDPRKTILLLVRELPGFGQTTTIKMAVQADNRNFVAHQACQTLLTDIWTGQLSDDNHYVKILISIFFFPIAPVLLKFREMERTPALESSIELRRVRLSTKKTKQGPTHNQMDSFAHEAERTTRPFDTYRSKLVYFFEAPIIKFSFCAISHLAFLLLYGVILLTDFYPTISVKEMILIAWVGTLLIDEIRQVIMDDAGNFRLKINNYIRDKWNVVDVIIILSFIAGMILRFIPTQICNQCFYAARIILALNLMTFFFRILNMFSIHRELGPKLVMIGKMMIDLFYFMLILLVFIAAYGISAHVILYPNQPLNIALARDVLSDAWWNLFGITPLEKVSGELCNRSVVQSSKTAEECASLDYAAYDEADCVSQKDAQCPAIDWLVPIVLAIYSLITSVMMLNLLIAMFSNTFSNIQGQTNVVWKMQRYHLVREYDSRPLVPPPLIILAHMYLFVRFISRRCVCPKDTSKFGFRMKFKANEEKELLSWENVNAEEYLRKMKQKERESADSKVKDTNERVDDILRKVDEISDTNFLLNSSSSANLPPVLEERLLYLEKQMQRTSQALDWIMKSLASLSSTNPPALPDVDRQIQEEKDRQKRDTNERIREATKLVKQRKNLHKRSRDTYYSPTKNQKAVSRLFVPDSKVPFSVEFPEYRPLSFTDSSVKDSAVDLKTCPFNQADNPSYLSYDVVDGYPLNPSGRTGLKGRGVLRSWGPNHVISIVITRWKKGKSHKVIEFVALQGKADEVCIPEAPSTFQNHKNAARKLLGEILQNSENIDEESFPRGNEVYSGYLDDRRNTDNAWLETTALNYHIEGKVMEDKVKIKIKEGNKWMTIRRDLDIDGTLLDILNQVAERHKADF